MTLPKPANTVPGTRFSTTMTRCALLGMLLSLGGISAAGCVEPNQAYQPGPAPLDQCRRGAEVRETFDEFEHPGELDILVAVDNSGSVARLQAALADALPDFLHTLRERGVSVRLGVVNTDAVAPDGLAPPGTIRDGCTRNTAAFADSDSPADWVRAAQCNVVQGERGDARQQALATLETGLRNRPGNLADFLRPRARVLLMVLSNEDDCSGPRLPDGGGGRGTSMRTHCARNAARLDDVDAWAARVRDLASTPQGISLAVLSGPPADLAGDGADNLRAVCQGALGAAYPANRLWQATRLFAAQGAFESICATDLNFNLMTLAERLDTPAPMTLCPSRRMVHEPLGLTAISASGDDTNIAHANDGFLYQGATDDCENGSVRLAPGILSGVASIDMRYCVD